MAEDDSSVIGQQPRFITGVTNALGLIAGITAIGSAFNAITEIFNVADSPSDFIVPDLANNGALKLGFRDASGGVFASSQVVTIVEPKIDNTLTVPRGTWKSLDFILNKTLSMDWKVKNADPGNTNILEAYRLAGRGYTRDGGSGQFSWAAAFVTWVLTKAGFTGLRSMSPLAYSTYGNAVKFHAGPMLAVRKWDIVIFSSIQNINHIGFIKSYNPSTKTIQILGGDQSDNVKITEMPFSITNPEFRVIHIRRNWIVPTENNTPLFSLPSTNIPIGAGRAGFTAGTPIPTNNLPQPNVPTTLPSPPIATR